MIRSERSAPASQGVLRVLVVEDHALVRQTLCDRLAGEADMAVVASASNGSQAMCKLLLHKPDVVLLDVDLDGLTSIGLISRLR
jgi:chemotaxis response regulator CheB